VIDGELPVASPSEQAGDDSPPRPIRLPGLIDSQDVLDVYIIYDPAAPDDATVHRDIAQAAQGNLIWLPATGMIEVLTLLRGLRDQALQARALVPQRPLTDHQRRVWALVAEGRSHTEIARTMGSSMGSVKRDIARIKAKLGVATTTQLKIAYRWTTERRGPR